MFCNVGFYNIVMVLDLDTSRVCLPHLAGPSPGRSGAGPLLFPGPGPGPSHLHKKVKETGIEPLGQGVAGVGCLLHIEGHVDGLAASTPAAVHLTAGELLLQPPAVDAQQVGGKGQHCQGWGERGRPVRLWGPRGGLCAQ